ncbi:MAG: UbiA family prenyltransferase, partial [Stackebrandtia sp.]
LSIGWCNDWIDAARDRVSRRADKPVANDQLSSGAARTAAFVGVAACVPLSLWVGPEGWLHLAAVAGAWAYNYPLKNTPFSLVPFAVSFGLLVAYVVPDPAPALIAVGALLGAAAHFANVLPDLEDDAATGVRGLPHRLGPRNSRLAASALMAGATLTLAYTVDVPYVLLAGALTALFVLAAGVAAPPRWTFRLVEAVALLNVAALLVATAI